MKTAPMIDRSRCSGCESCVSVCPEVFEWDEDLGAVWVRDLEEYPEDALNEAVAYCPEECISIEK